MKQDISRSTSRIQGTIIVGVEQLVCLVSFSFGSRGNMKIPNKSYIVDRVRKVITSRSSASLRSATHD